MKREKKLLLLSLFTVLMFSNSAYGATNTEGAGAGVAVGDGSSAPKVENVAIGKNAKISYSNGNSNATGDIVVGNDANINNYASQGGSIAIGKNAKIENMTGRQESIFGFGQTEYKNGNFLGTLKIPAEPEKVTGTVVIGDNTFARTGGTMIGSHNYRGKLGDIEIDTSKTRNQALNVYATTVGANSFSHGAFATTTGAFSIISSDYNGGGFSLSATKNIGASIYGSLNSIESSTASSSYSGIANAVVGVANRTNNSNGTLIFGAGNEITNSVENIATPSNSEKASVKELSDKLREVVRSSNSGGSTMAFGGGNKADYTKLTSMIGVNNTVTGVAKNVSMMNTVTGYNNTVKDSDYNIVSGSNHKLENSAGNIILGFNEKDIDTTKNKSSVGTGQIGAGITNSIAIGNNTVLTGNNSIAFGAGAEAKEKSTIAIGEKAQATGENSVVIGNISSSEGKNSSVFGNKNILKGNKSTGNSSVVAGNNQDVEGINNAVFGTDYFNGDNKLTHVYGDQNTVLGVGNLVGYTAEEDPDDNIKWKYTKADSSSDQNTIVGMTNQATGSGNVVVGSSSTVEGDAISLGTGNTVGETVMGAMVLGKNSKAKADYAIGIGYEVSAEKDWAIAMGQKAKANEAAVAIGREADAGEYAIAIGTDSKATGNSSISIGVGNEVSGMFSGAIGDPTTITGNQSYSIGNTNTITSNSTMVLGNNITADIENSVYLGQSSSASTGLTEETAGTTTYNSVKINGTTYNFAAGATNGIVSVGSVGAERRIQNVAAGLISENSTDAINGSQLYAVASKIKEDIGNIEKVAISEGKNVKVVSNTKDGIKTYTVNADKTTVSAGSGLKVTTGTKDTTTYITDYKIDLSDETKNTLGQVSKNTQNIANNTTEIKNLKTSVAAAKTEVKSKDKSVTITEMAGTNGQKVYDLSVDTSKISAATNISYKANGNNSQTTSLANGLDFTNGTNTTAEVGANGVVKYNLKDNINLTSVVTKDSAGNTTVQNGAGINITSTNGNTISLTKVGLNNGGNKITNIAAGTDDTDVVNVKQLKATKTEVTSKDNSVSVTETTGTNGQKVYDLAVDTSKTDKKINGLQRDVADLQDEVGHVGSLGAALAALNPIQFDKNKPNQIMAGVGHYKDSQSIAVGLGHYFTENLLITAGIAVGGEKRAKSMANVGLTWKFGKSEKEDRKNLPEEIKNNIPEEFNERPITSIQVMQNEIMLLKNKDKENRRIIEEQLKKNAEQEERMRKMEEQIQILLKRK